MTINYHRFPVIRYGEGIDDLRRVRSHHADGDIGDFAAGPAARADGRPTLEEVLAGRDAEAGAPEAEAGPGYLILRELTEFERTVLMGASGTTGFTVWGPSPWDWWDPGLPNDPNPDGPYGNGGGGGGQTGSGTSAQEAASHEQDCGSEDGAAVQLLST